jgi:tetratricopeptide (TPR) repeat protein
MTSMSAAGETLEGVHQTLRAGRAAEAEELCRRIVAERPSAAEAVAMLGMIRSRRGDAAESVRLLRTACALAPGSPGYLNNLALALKQSGDFEAAVGAYRRSLALEPGSVHVLANLGRLLRQGGRGAAAAECFRQALAASPDSPELLALLADTLAEQGNGSAPAELYRRVIALRPDWVAAHYSLALAKRFAGEDDADLLALRRLAGAPRTVEERIVLSFALGKACDDLGQYERAFAHFAAGNDLKRAQLPAGGLDREIERIERIAESFRGTRPARSASRRGSRPLPIFLVGLPRAGKSLLEEQLACYRGVHAGGESGLLEVRTGSGKPLGHDDLQALPASEIADLAAGLAGRLRGLAPAASRITNTMPGNFALLGLIHQLLPQAPIVHCVREPLDTALACYFKLFVQGWDFTYDLADLGRYYAAYERLMRRWGELLPGAILTVRYEDLVRAPAAATRRVARFCGLGESDRIAPAPVLRADEVGRWRRYEPHLEPLVRALAAGRRAAPSPLPGVVPS